MIAFCEINSTDYSAYNATQKKDEIVKIKLAEAWRTYEYPLQSEDINCDGCLAVGKQLVKFCKDCEIRNCGQEKHIKNCAYCCNYPCEKLKTYWMMNHVYDAKSTLEELREFLREIRWSILYPILSQDVVFRNVPTNPGIYILWKIQPNGNTECIYVDKTTNLAKRMHKHARFSSENEYLRKVFMSNPVGFIFAKIVDPDQRDGIQKFLLNGAVFRFITFF